MFKIGFKVKILEEKKLKESEKRVKQYINDGIVKTKGKAQHD